VVKSKAAPVRIAMTMKELAWPLLMNVRPLTVPVPDDDGACQHAGACHE